MHVRNGMVYFDKGDFQRQGGLTNNQGQTTKRVTSQPVPVKTYQKISNDANDVEDDYQSIFLHDNVQGALKRLEKQVVDVQGGYSNKFRRDNVKKLYRINGSRPGSSNGVCAEQAVPSDPETSSYHQNLHASLQVFQIKKWRPLTPELVPKQTVTRCRPVSGRPYSSLALTEPYLLPPGPSSEPPPTRPTSRVGSAPVYLRRPDTPRVEPGNFDTLSPRVLAHLVTDPRPQTPNSTYGDVLKIKHGGKRTKGKKKEEKEKEDKAALPPDADLSSTSGVDSDGEESGDEEDDEKDSDDDDDDDSDNDSISELEKGNEPPVDLNRLVPDLHLRPEKLDHVYTPENKRDMRRFDFDAEKVDIPMYEFECPVPSPFDKINFRFHARENSDWRFSSNVIGPVNTELSSIFDRLVEIEKRQIETEEWEDRKLRNARKRPVPPRSAKQTRDRRCCSSCLQAACVGDCPNKRVPPNCCEKCHQPLCTGTCSDTKYDQRMRQPREDLSAAIPPRTPVPQNCKTCQRRHNAKYINANQVVLGRPKSAFSTFSRGKSSAKPKDLRPKSALSISDGLSKDIEKVGLEPIQPTPPSSAKPPRPRSRGDMMPGKSYYSNLNRSLTELSIKRRRSAKTRKKVVNKTENTGAREQSLSTVTVD